MDVHSVPAVRIRGMRGTDRRRMSTVRPSARARASRARRGTGARVTVAVFTRPSSTTCIRTAWDTITLNSDPDGYTIELDAFVELE
jgi:hypothetical protein